LITWQWAPDRRSARQVGQLLTLARRAALLAKQLLALALSFSRRHLLFSEFTTRACVNGECASYANKKADEMSAFEQSVMDAIRV
jgi:hypothetical protein